MLAAWSTRVPEGEDWVYEPKWDGFRALVRIDGDGSVRVFSRTGQAWTQAFPELQQMGRAIGRPLVVDGEIIVLDRAGIPSYDRLSRRLRERRAEWAARANPITLVAFDVLEMEGESLLDMPWWMRRDVLARLDWPGTSAVPTMAVDDGEALLSATRSLGLEGVMCKRRRGRYVCGRRTNAWVKIKHPGSGWFDVVGWRPRSKAFPAGGYLIADEGRPAGTVTPGLASAHAAALTWFVDRHGAPDGPAIRVPHGAQVRVHYRERSARGLVQDGIAHEMRVALPGSG